MAADVRHDALHRLSIDEYHRLVRAGGLDEDARIELLDGLLVDMSPKSPQQHENAVAWHADRLRRDLDGRPALHAQAAVREYWVVDLDGRRAVRHADPRDGAYRDVGVHGAEGTQPGDGAGLPPLAVGDVLEAAGV